MKRSKLLALLLMLMVSIAIQAQNVSVRGLVQDNTGEPIIGASVVQKGNTGVGTVTDLDGQFQLSVPQGTQLVISYIGYLPQTVTAAPNVNVVLKEDAETLEDVVVVGYGVQKKSVVTAAIAKVSAEDLALTAPVRMDNALKGLAAGVNVTSSSGAPGAGSKIRIRGNGTVNNSDPLYIVDGMPIEGDIDYLAPSDIESIEVLKDAASAAVYGARAANGVILVTTKSGQMGKTIVNYNFSQGWQTAWKHRDVLNAMEYGVMMNEGHLNAGRAPEIPDPYSLGEGTDWQSEVFNNNAPVSNHEVNVSGATEKVNYYLSMNAFSQDGIVGGNYDKSNYRRMTLRSNTKYTVFDETAERDWLNKLTLTSNISYSRERRIGAFTENGNSHGVLHSALTLAPTLPVVYKENIDDYIAKYTQDSGSYVPQYDADGNLYMVPGTDYDNQMNPVAFLNTPSLGSWTKYHKFVTNFAADLSLGYGFSWRTSYGADMTFWNQEGYTAPYFLTSSMNWGGKTGASAQHGEYNVWQLENVLTWARDFGAHSFNVVLGQSAKKYSGYGIYASKNYLVDLEKPYVDYTTGHLEGDVGASAGPYDIATLASLFARFSYNYDERYMLQATVRRDGSSRFGSNNHYAIFPSFSLGWNVHNEKFMESTRDWLSKFKVRASWGKNGNENIGNYAYAAYTTATGAYSTIFGRGEGEKAIGTRVNGLANPNVRWEESVQTNLGLDLGFFNSALTFSVDYFLKKTNGMLLPMPLPSYISVVQPWANVGKMENSGWEFELSYKGNVGDFKYFVKGNAAYLKNKLVELGNETGEASYDQMQSVGAITRGKNGLPWPYFYGYKTAGVFQTAAEAEAYNQKYGLTGPNARVPGDLIFENVNGDTTIDDNDKTMIGKGTPDWTFGFTVGAEWKGFDFSMFWQGTQGNDIYDATMRVDKENQNLPSWILGRWTGEGTSNRIPRFVTGADSHNKVSSDLYVCDGSYLRLKNIQLGYTLPKNLTKKAAIERLRFYVMAENLLTFTKYWGYDPEISSGGTSLGVDKGVYPQARTFTVGVNLTFGAPNKKKADVAVVPQTQYVEKVVEKPVTKEVVKEVVKTNTVQNTYVVTFPVNSYQILNTAELDGIQQGANVDVVAYASPEGNADANLALSQKRADAVADYLKSRGVNVNRVQANGADTEHANRIAIVTVK